MKIRAYIKKHLWLASLSIVVAGGFSAIFPVLGMFEDLSQYFFGFFILGLGMMDFGVLLALIPLYASEEKKNNKTKIRIILMVAVAIYLFLIGYLLWIKAMRLPEFEWKVEALVSGQWTVFGTFTFTHYTAFFVTLISFAIIILPFAIDELGILDNYPDEPPDHDVEG